MKKNLYSLLIIIISIYACSSPVKENTSFNFFSEQFSDVKILRYQVPGFENLTLDQKKLVYYLTQAGLSGRNIMYDQNYRHNLKIRDALENIFTNYKGDKSSKNWIAFETYLKKVWFANGIHHHYSNDKFEPEFSPEYFNELLLETNTTLEGEAYEVIFNDNDSKKVNLDSSKGLIKGSAVNFYGRDITTEEVDDFYSKIKVPNSKKPISLGLNSKLVNQQNSVSQT